MALAAVLLVHGPRLKQYWGGPPERVFLGSVWGAHDAPAYLGMLGDAAHGQWLASATRTPQGYSGGSLLYTPYLLLGHALAWTGWPPETVFELGRWVATAVVLTAAWIYIRASLPASQRGFGFFAAVLAGGVGFLFLTRPMTPLGPVVPLDLAGPSFTVANALQMGPHVLLAVSGLGIFGWGLLRAAQGQWKGLWAAPALAAVASFHGFVVPMALLAGTVFVVWRARSRCAVSVLLASYLLTAPLLGYLVWLRFNDPSVMAWQRVEYAEFEDIPSLLVSRAILWPLIAIGAWRALRGGSLGCALALCWVASALCFGLAPLFATNALHRTVEGSSLAYGVLAAEGFGQLRPRLRPYVVGLACVSPLLLASAVTFLPPADPEESMARSDYQAVVWLRQTGSREQVLAAPDTVRWVVALTSARPDPGPGEASAPRLPIDDIAAAEPSDRARLLGARGSTLLFWGARERARDGDPPSGFEVLFSSGGTTLLKVPDHGWGKSDKQSTTILYGSGPGGPDRSGDGDRPLRSQRLGEW